MAEVLTVGILGFGEVGSMLFDGLAASGHCVKVWDIQFECASSPAALRLKDRPGTQVVSSACELAAQSDVLISAVTAGNAVEALRSCLAGLVDRCFYFDLNSVSVNTKTEMAGLVNEHGGRFVEAAIMSPIRPKGLSSPMLIGGASANDFLSVGRALGFSSLNIASLDIGRASATKMCRSVMIKGMEALVTESMVAARHYGVLDEVLGSLDNLLPREDWPELAEYMIRRSIEHGTRRSEEMIEAARTVANAGLDPLMARACADRQAVNPRFGSALEADDLSSLLDSILTQIKSDALRELQ